MTGTPARPFSTDPALTAMAVNFQNPEAAMIADDVLPRVPVGGETYKYDYYPPEEIFTVPDTTVGRRGQVPQYEFSSQQRTGVVLDRGIDIPIPQSDIDEAARQRAQGNTAYDPEARAVEGATHIVKLDREKRVANLIQDPTTYDADKRLTLAGADKWTDPDSNPIADIKAGQSATFIARPNIGATSRTVFDVLSQHPRIVKAVRGNDGGEGVVTPEEIARVLGLQALFVGEAFGNTARKGQPAQMSRLWGNGFSLLHRNLAASNDNGLPTFGFTAELRTGASAMFSGRIPSPMAGGLKGGVMIRTGEQVEEHIMTPSVGYFIDAPI